MAAQRLLFSVIDPNKSGSCLHVFVRSLKTSTKPVLLRSSTSIPSSYTRERRFSPVFRARSLAPTAMDLNRRREIIASDQILRHGQENVVRRSQFTDWNYSAEISAFQARLRENFDEEKLYQAFKTREYLEDMTIQRRRTFGVDSQNAFDQEGNSYQ